MSMSFKKALRKEYTYIDKTCKNHDYTIKCILEITNDNIHAAGNYYGKKEYYKVIKCSKCNSFIPNSEEGNYSGHFFNEDDIDKTLPLIIAKTNKKSPAYVFCDLYDVKINKGE